MVSCNSCGRMTVDFDEFPCPSCGSKVRRCRHCRMNGVKWECKCKMQGP